MSTILIVDDEPDTLLILSMLLRGEGFEVKTAADGVEALEQAREELPAAVITDFMMPRMDGLEFCRELRMMAERKIPVVMATASATLPKECDGRFDLILRKPVDFRALIQAVKQLLPAV